MSERVLVTGCCGYLGAWITVSLLRAGFAVRGSSREPDYARKLFDEVFGADAAGEALRARLEVVPGELLDAASWRGAAEGCDAVVHTACPVATDAGTPARAMLEPAVQGTENVQREAARAGVLRRFVYVSSVVALLDHHRPSPERDARVGPAD